MTSRDLGVLVVCVLWTPAAVLAAGPSPVPAALDLAAMDSYPRGEMAVRGLAVTVVDGDQVVFARGYGTASAGHPVTAQTQF